MTKLSSPAHDTRAPGGSASTIGWRSAFPHKALVTALITVSCRAPWTPDLQAEPDPDKTSSAVVLSWQAEGLCEDVRHFRLCDDGGTCVDTEDADASALTVEHLHPATSYEWSITACTSDGCGEPCPSEGASEAEVITEPERWLLVGVDSYDSPVRAFLDKAGNNPAVPAMVQFSAGRHEGAVGIYFVDADSHVRLAVQAACARDGWQDDCWNEGWEVLPGTIIESAGGQGPFARAANISVQPSLRDGEPRWTMFFTAHDATDHTDDYGLYSVDSAGVDGDAWDDLLCEPGPCMDDRCAEGHPCDYDHAEGLVELLDGTETCLSDGDTQFGWHGRPARDPAEPWDPEREELLYLITAADRPAEGDCAPCGVAGEDAADLDMVRLSPGEEPGLVTDEAGCPRDYAVDLHDPSVTAVPSGEIKVYAIEGLERLALHHTTDLETWQDDSDVEVLFESGEAMSPGCVEDISTWTWTEDGETHEMMALTPLLVPDAAGSECFTVNGAPHPGLMMAILTN